MHYVMLAAYEDGSVAEMPIPASHIGMANDIAREWLNTYEHGFAQAIVIPAIESMSEWSTDFVWGLVMELSPASSHLL